MSFNISRIVIKNRAPFVDDLDLCFESNGVTVLTAVNGKGKTTLLSYIVDAWVEMTRSAYKSSYIGKENRYYRISSSLFSIDSSKPSMVYIRFNNNGNNIDYIDLRNYCSQGEYEMLTNGLGCLVGYALIKDKLEQDGYIKYLSSQDYKEIRSIWNNNIVTYFPSYRHFDPYYLTDYYKEGADYSTLMSYSDVLPNPIESKMDIQKIVNWIMDVAIDAELNKRVDEANIEIVKQVPEDALWDNVQTIVRKALISKYPDGDVRLAISRRGHGIQRVSVTNNAGDKIYCPSVYHLSSGELEVLCLFAEILRQADVLHNNIQLQSITGVVLVDEIELHLHIRPQKEVLPALMQLFPNVQFIVSSHSPFLNMGLADNENERDRARIIDLDNKGVVSSPTTNEVYQDFYELWNGEKDQYAKEVSILKSRIDLLTKPLVITEGKTDIKLIKKAFEKFAVPVSFDILPDIDQPNGCRALDKMLSQISLLTQRHKVICIFDSDVSEYVKKYGYDGEWCKNNVYAFCIPVPSSRKKKGQTEISIEYLFTDEEIHSILPDGTRLFFGNEFETSSIRKHITDKTLRLSLPDGCGKDKIVENNGGQAVYIDGTDENILAKKESFAEAIVNDQVTISNESWNNFRPIIDIIQMIIGE